MRLALCIRQTEDNEENEMACEVFSSPFADTMPNHEPSACWLAIEWVQLHWNKGEFRGRGSVQEICHNSTYAWLFDYTEVGIKAWIVAVWRFWKYTKALGLFASNYRSTISYLYRKDEHFSDTMLWGKWERLNNTEKADVDVSWLWSVLCHLLTIQIPDTGASYPILKINHYW